MSVLRCHPDCHVEFAVIRPAGFRILGALDHVARAWVRDLWLTSGTEGVHSKNPDGTPNLTDPHKTGEAYDLMSHDCVSVAEKQALVKLIVTQLCDHPDEEPFATDGGFIEWRRVLLVGNVAGGVDRTALGPRALGARPVPGRTGGLRAGLRGWGPADGPPS